MPWLCDGGGAGQVVRFILGGGSGGGGRARAVARASSSSSGRNTRDLLASCTGNGVGDDMGDGVGGETVAGMGSSPSSGMKPLGGFLTAGASSASRCSLMCFIACFFWENV
jgi:hypothetical protein